MATTWGSRNAEDMYRIAVRLGGFDARELMLEIVRRSGRRDAERTNESTVLAAMQAIYERHHDEDGAETCSRCGEPDHPRAMCPGAVTW